MDRYKRLVALLLGLILSLSFLTVFVPMQVAADDPDDGLDLFFSEYIEGAVGNNKVLEIFNPTNRAINISDYLIRIYSNGKNTYSTIRLNNLNNMTDSMISPGSTFVIVHSGAREDVKSLADGISGSLSFNGDDAIALCREVENDVQIVDRIGQAGYDPDGKGLSPTEWISIDDEGNSVSTKDSTLIRRSSVFKGDRDLFADFDPADEWYTFHKHNGEHYLHNLGQHEIFTYTVVFDSGFYGSIPVGAKNQKAYPGMGAIAPVVNANQGYEFYKWDKAFDHVTGDITVNALYIKTSTDGPDLFFSEYIEGAGDVKALELFNPTDVFVDLADYQIKIFYNGNSTAGATVKYNESFYLESGGTFVFGDAGLKDVLEYIPDQLIALGFNGNDAIVLYKNGIAIDRIGRVGEDPEPKPYPANSDGYKGWVGSKVQTANRTLVRKPTVTQGDRNYSAPFDPSDEWLSFPQNTIRYLGSHKPVGIHQVVFDLGDHGSLKSGSAFQQVYDQQAAIPPGVKPKIDYSIVGWKQDLSSIISDLDVKADYRSWTEPGLFFSKYIEGTSNNKALEIFNGTGSPIDLKAGGYSVQIYFDGKVTPGRTILLEGIVPSKATFLLSHTEAAQELRDAGQQTAAANWFNGNDAVVLMKGTRMVDCIGKIGEDPDPSGVTANMVGWNDNGVQTGNRTLIRKPEVGEGVTACPEYFDPSLQWLVLGQDTTGTLGSHNCDVIHTVKFIQGSGGSLAGQLNQTVYTGRSAVLPVARASEGHTFLGWVGNYSNVLKDETVKALWKTNRYTISFDSAGGSELPSISQDYGTEIKRPADPVREGYTFLGWDQEVPESMPAGDLKLTAQWKINKHGLTFYTACGTAIEPIMLEYGSKIAIPEDPARPGARFVRWEPVIPATMPDRDLELVAIWDVDPHTIIFDTRGGNPIEPIVLAPGSKIKLPEDPVRVGHTFLGWEPDVPSVMPECGIELFARWKVNQYTITFDTRGGSAVESMTLDYGSPIVLPEPPTHELYVFAGWKPALPATMPAEDLKVTARWWVDGQVMAGEDDLTGEEKVPPTGVLNPYLLPALLTCLSFVLFVTGSSVGKGRKRKPGV